MKYKLTLVILLGLILILTTWYARPLDVTYKHTVRTQMTSEEIAKELPNEYQHFNYYRRLEFTRVKKSTNIPLIYHKTYSDTIVNYVRGNI